ncbi:MAG TPA: hypothetical protein VN224_02145 [Xanthomonadales bacterium]|nr:hypothetical protein [Xanthomonadales bacterium]
MKEEPEAFVIGAAMARAARVELDRVARGLSGRGPLSPDMRYDRWAGDYSLAEPVTRPADAALRAVCRRYATADEKERAKQTAASSMDDFYTLLQFAKRCAVFALRERRLDYVVDGLSAVAMIDPRRIDERDAPSPLPLLAYAARTLGAAPEPLFATAAELARPDAREIIVGFLPRSGRTLSDGCYAAVETPAGPGFVDVSVDPYDPTGPLDRVALALADAIGGDSYERGTVTVATEIPDVWLSGIDDAALSRALSAVRAAATVHAALRPGVAGDGYPESRGIIIFVAELADVPSASALVRIAEAKSAIPSDIALLGAGAGRLFCLIVARSFVQGVAPVETSQSLRRFEPRVSASLRGFAHEYGRRA